MNERELQAFKVGFCKHAAELGVTPSELLRYKVAYTGMVPEPMEGGGGGPYSGPSLDLGPTLRDLDRDIGFTRNYQQTPGGAFYGPSGLGPVSPFTRENPYSEAINDPNTFRQLANSYPRVSPLIPGSGVFNGGMNLAGMVGAQRMAIGARSDRDRPQQHERDRLAPGLQAYEQRMNYGVQPGKRDAGDRGVATPATVKFGPERDARIAAQTAAREARDRAAQQAQAPAPNLPYADRAGGFNSPPAAPQMTLGDVLNRHRATGPAQASVPDLEPQSRAGGFNSPPAQAAPQAAPQMTPETRAGMNTAANVMGNLPGGGLAAAAMRGAAGTPYFLARENGGPGDEAMSPAVTARREENTKLKNDLGLNIGSTPSPSAGSESFAFGSGRKVTPPTATAAAPQAAPKSRLFSDVPSPSESGYAQYQSNLNAQNQQRNSAREARMGALATDLRNRPGAAPGVQTALQRRQPGQIQYAPQTMPNVRQPGQQQMRPIEYGSRQLPPNQKVGSLQDIGSSAIKTLLLAASGGILAGGASGALANYLYNKSKDVIDPEQSMLPEFSEADEAKKLHIIARYRNAADEIRRGLV